MNVFKSGFRVFLFGTLALSSVSVFAQKKVTPPAAPATTAPKADTVKDKGPLKPYTEIIPAKAITKKGLFIVHQVDTKWFLEIPDSLLNRDMLVVSRLSKAGADMRAGMSGYAGDQINNAVIRFEKGPSNKIFLRKISYSEYSKDTSMPMYQAVMNSNIQPIAAAFEVKTIHPDSKATVIDFTDFLSGDNDVLFFDPNAKPMFKLGALQADKSYVAGINTYPINTEIKTVKTYMKAAAGPGAMGGGTVTVEINSSMVLLPAKLMTPRYFDERVGYFAVGYTDFDANPQGIKTVSMIKRWNLEPKDEDLAKYKKGELVEPKKQIIFYIDPATPKKWVPYLIKGVNDWQKTFEKAGFKNAIVAKMAPAKAEDSTWSLEDARFSAIVYKPSSVPNASGPSISDPRTGEIMESHVNWYHNVMKLLRDWYFIQASAIDPRARSMKFSDELMGELIRFVSSHEIGHTLGLRHNFGSSSTVPVEKLRDKKWLEENGHTPSIMDYARFNYVAQPEDNISEKGIFPRIGDYDEWAIEWGYTLLPQFNDPEKEEVYLNKWVIEKLKNKRLWFGTEMNPDDPRSQNEDLGDNAMKAGEYGIKNLQRVTANLTTWTKQEAKDFSDLQSIYKEVTGQYMRYMGHVIKNIGGIYETPKTADQDGQVYEFVPKATQKEAMAFLNKNVFTVPTWLINPSIFNKIGTDPVATITDNQDKVLGSLLNTGRMTKLINAESQLGSNAYTLAEYMSDLKKSVMSGATGLKPISVYRRNLQKSYIDKLIAIAKPAAPAGGPSGGAPAGMMIMMSGSSSKNNDVVSVVKATLKSVRKEITAALPAVSDPMSRYHLQDCLDRISEALEPAK